MKLKLPFGIEIELRRETDDERSKREEKALWDREKNAEAYRRFFGLRL